MLASRFRGEAWASKQNFAEFFINQAGLKASEACSLEGRKAGLKASEACDLKGAAALISIFYFKFEI